MSCGMLAQAAAGTAGGSAAGAYDPANDAALQEALHKYWSVAPELLQGMTEASLCHL